VLFEVVLDLVKEPIRYGRPCNLGNLVS